MSDFFAPSDEGDTLKTKFFRHRAVPHFARLEEAHRSLPPGERLLVHALVGILLVSALTLVVLLSRAASVEVPSRAGALVEGIVGSPRFVNPLLALSGSDKDLSMLIYSGLMRATPDGKLIPDLASSYEISEDGTTYTFTLREGLTFHDGSALTSADALFTIERAKDPAVKSSRRADWEGVAASAPDPRTVVFTLPHAYAPFLENATLGILPKHLWESISTEDFAFHALNTHPVGSGPYSYKEQKTNSSGAITRYELSLFDRFALGAPYLEKITFHIFRDDEELVEAFNAGRVDAIASISPSSMESVKRDASIGRVALPRTFAVFLNQNKNTVFADETVRKALDAAIDKERLIADVLKGFGEPLDGPVLPALLGPSVPAMPQPLSEPVEEAAPRSGFAERARGILSSAGWTFSESEGTWKKKDAVLAFTLATADEPELSAAAERVAAMWQDAGIKVSVHVYPLSELNSLVLRPRAYEAVLFGEVVGRSLDLFAFWHSSQRNDPGLNLALYTNSKADSLLTRARETTDREARLELYADFQEIARDDVAAVFLFAPEFLYIVPSDLHGIALGALSDPSERFLNVHEWYVDTERVWNFFTQKTSEEY